MTVSNAQFERLLPVLDSVFRAKQAQLAKATQKVSDLKNQLTLLDRPSVQNIDAPSVRAGADVLWDRWVKDKRKLITQELALASRDREEARAEVAAAFAKLEVVRNLNKSLHDEQKKVKERRASW